MYSSQSAQVSLWFAVFVAFLISIPGYVLALYQYNSAKSEEMQRLAAEYQKNHERTARVAAESKAQQADSKAADAERRLVRATQLRGEPLQSRSAASPPPQLATSSTPAADAEKTRQQLNRAYGPRISYGERQKAQENTEAIVRDRENALSRHQAAIDYAETARRRMVDTVGTSYFDQALKDFRAASDNVTHTRIAAENAKNRASVALREYQSLNVQAQQADRGLIPQQACNPRVQRCD